MAVKKPDNKRPMLYVLFVKYGLKGACQIFKEDILFDVIHRTNTAMPVGQTRLFGSTQHKNQNRYVASTFQVLHSVLDFAASQVDITQCGFVDLGSGKGKALIAATKYSFGSIKGIDTSELMHQVATKNLKKLELDGHVQLLHQSATHPQLLPHERVIYFFNSFTGDILDQCLQAMSAAPREGKGLLIYVNPTEDAHIQQYFPLIRTEFLQPGNCEVSYYQLPAKRHN